MAANDGKSQAASKTEENDLDKSKKSAKATKHDSGAADLEKVTDFVEETEISAENFQQAMMLMNDQKVREAKEKQEHERELSRIKINKADVEFIMREMEIPQKLAERKLREHNANVVQALVDLTN